MEPTKENLHELYTIQKWPREEIAKKFGITTPQVMKLLASYGIRKYKDRDDVIPKETLLRLYFDEDLTAKEVAQRLGYTGGSIYFYLKKYEIKKPAASRIERAKKANRKKYGVDFPLQSQKILKKTRESLRSRLGCDYPLQNKEIHAQTVENRDNEKGNAAFRQTCRDKYGVENVGQIEEVKKKILQTKKIKRFLRRFSAIRARQEKSTKHSPLTKREFREKLNCPGVYQIRNLKNNKVYVGSTINIYQRWMEHKSALRRGVHYSPHLQHSYNKYGKGFFKIRILEWLENPTNESLAAAEQKWLDKKQSYNHGVGYNISPTAFSNFGTVRSEETKAKISAANIKRFSDPEERQKQSVRLKRAYVSKELRERHREIQVKHHREHPERAEKHSIALKKYWSKEVHREQQKTKTKEFFRKHPEVAAKRREFLKEHWSDVDRRKEMSQKKKEFYKNRSEAGASNIDTKI